MMMCGCMERGLSVLNTSIQMHKSRLTFQNSVFLQSRFFGFVFEQYFRTGDRDHAILLYSGEEYVCQMKWEVPNFCTVHFQITNFLDPQILYSYQLFGYMTLLWNLKCLKIIRCFCLSVFLYHSVFQPLAVTL